MAWLFAAYAKMPQVLFHDARGHFAAHPEPGLYGDLMRGLARDLGTCLTP